ncbi:site-specific integrase [Parafrankia sp. FMc6]|uniref:site-specific integrase n=1 Tax=Parafrankia soli TaxID=2599596 RepID=UPI0034D5D7E3
MRVGGERVAGGQRDGGETVRRQVGAGPAPGGDPTPPATTTAAAGAGQAADVADVIDATDVVDVVDAVEIVAAGPVAVPGTVGLDGPLAGRVGDYARASRSAATWRAYDADLRHFRSWCEGRPVPLVAVPASAVTVAGYITELADAGYAPSTIRRRLAAISVAHQLAHAENPTGSVARIVQRRVAAAGLDPADFAGHSLRSGFATAAARAGVTDRSIMRQGRWRSAASLESYVRAGRLFDADNPSGRVGL